MRERSPMAVATTNAPSCFVTLMMVGVAAASFLAFHGAEAAFQDGITGSSFRIGSGGDETSRRWSREVQRKRSRNLQASGVTSTSAKESCEAARAREEADIAPGGGSSKCSCRKTALDERYAEFMDISQQPNVYELSCVDHRCSYCSADGSTCDRFSYGALFEEMQILDGAVIRDVVAQVGYFETNQYIVGRPEAVVYTEFNDPSNPGSHTCSMEIDGLQCAVCEYVNCVGGDDGSSGGIDTYYGMNVVCSNILIGDGNGGYVSAADFETCDPGQLEAIGGAQGVFEMYDPDYGQCFTSVEGCERDKTELEQTGYYECECRAEDLHTDGVSPFLQNVQLRCAKSASGGNAFGEDEVCGDVAVDTIDRTYSSYVTETNTRVVEQKDGSVVTIEEFECLNTKGAGDGCKACRAFVDGTMCDACEMRSCGRILTPFVSCSNALDDGGRAAAPIDLCRPAATAGTPFETFRCGFGEASKVPVVPIESPTEAPVPTQAPVPAAASDNNNNNNNNIFVEPDSQEQQQETEIQVGGTSPQTKAVSMLACEEKRREFAQRTGNFIDSSVLKCECFLIDETGRVDEGSLLTCSTLGGSCGETNGGSVCNAVYAATVEDVIDVDNVNGNGNNGGGEENCFREEIVQGFLPDGSTTPLTRTTTYTRGSSLENSLVGRTLVLTEYGGGSDGCQLLLDGEACASCVLEFCGSLGMRPVADCANVVDDPTFSLRSCDDYRSYEGGFLLRLAATVGGDGSAATDFRTCSEEFPSPTPEPVPENDGGGSSSNNDDSDSDNNDNDSDSSSSNNNIEEEMYNVDPSLPLTCPKAQPIVLPALRDDPALDPASIRTLDLTNPNSNFALVSFVSSTLNLPPPASSMPSCAGGGSESPGLWYSLGGRGTGVHASVCRESTDFEARISVYEGVCENEDTTLECIAGTTSTTSDEEEDEESLCNVHWFAEEGKTYYIRVHGSDASQTGTFNLFLETLEEEVTDSCFSEDAGEYDQACLSCHNAKSARISQFQGDPSEMDCRCLENAGTGGYHLTCVDLSCLKCNQKQDTCGFGTHELEIKRSESVPRASYESFYFLTEPVGETTTMTASDVLSIQESDCLTILDPYQQCLYALEETMANSEEVFCECRQTSEEGDHMLLCSVYDTHEYCVGTEADDDRVCATSVFFGQSISRYGSVISEFRNYNVPTDVEADAGTEASLTVERTGDICVASIDDETCASCLLLSNCGGGRQTDDVLDIASEPSGTTYAPDFTDLSIDCSNLIDEEKEDPFFDCGDSSGGLLSILSGTVSPKDSGEESTQAEDGDGEIADSTEDGVPDDVVVVQKQQTIPPDAFPPTSPPVTRPTSPPIEPIEAPSMPPALVAPTVLDLAELAGNHSTTNATSEEEEKTADPKESSSSSAALGAWPERRPKTRLATLVATAAIVITLLL
eukprot:CAMPEP_0197176224 /NCGR_PEP_ID=MMETSP1423-20130617/2219_1 /TAXON_ID=476441 /ORGANISM="Pseudo-nitzschia heimii, Strain UNC1101" /LENGTH=1424 /DNA_ID=CAMNT_0042625565 /DNA_START=310 /DNA_END=4584 /DNA_ORIENTATION=+